MVRDLRAKLDAPRTAELHVLQVLPQVIQQRLEVRVFVMD
jgi:hypothetical protein